MKYALENSALNYLQELLKDEKYYTEQLEDSYVMLNACRNQRNKLEEEKQQLISFLEDKIKEIDNEIKIKQLTQQGNPGLLQEIHELRIISLTYQEVLDFGKKGGKDD